MMIRLKRKELITSVWSNNMSTHIRQHERDMMRRRERRPAVNLMDRSVITNENANYPNPKDYCPREGRKLIYRSDIDNLFYCDCRWQPEKRREEEQQPKTHHTGPAIKNKLSTNGDDIFCIPLSKSRTQQLEDEMKQRLFPGYDSHLERIEKQGGVIIRSVEWLPLDDGTYTTSSDESLHNYLYTIGYSHICD
jgi:hypothetical protein